MPDNRSPVTTITSTFAVDNSREATLIKHSVRGIRTLSRNGGKASPGQVSELLGTSVRIAGYNEHTLLTHVSPPKQ
ncbi:hypothetical protein HH1059_21460 [Halorhodospira halochloris]|uniref:Uncharacterized protein n=1 Tax=Halorhodospira halochloris TaxID=1052 RepID=A0A2Z6EZU3_HALHR|nr:hypothetical protein HH1059_21460 [Halorhodospira halochloris]